MLVELDTHDAVENVPALFCGEVDDDALVALSMQDSTSLLVRMEEMLAAGDCGCTETAGFSGDTIMIDRLNGNSITVDQLIERHKRDDSAFGEEWEGTAFAREVAHAVIRYRVDKSLSIEQLADLLGVESETVGELEDGEIDPDVGTLRRLSAHLGLRFTLDIHPADPTGAEMTYSVA